MKLYHGRFAPTPSGALHFGSLVAAIGSYLCAKSQNGFWHLRIEDIDTPRCDPKNSLHIIKTLENYGFKWDGPIVYQSQNLNRYEEVLSELIHKNLTYNCACTRAQLKSLTNKNHSVYCRALNLPFNFNNNTSNYSQNSNVNIRFKNPETIQSFADKLQGIQHIELNDLANDFILKRKDGLFAYNLVAIVDDLDINVTEVIRGQDLITTTFAQMELLKALDQRIPTFGHIPLAMQTKELKFSKQNKAPIIDEDNKIPFILMALKFLGQNIPLEPQNTNSNSLNLDDFKKLNYQDITLDNIWEFAISNFDINKIPKNNIIIKY